MNVMTLVMRIGENIRPITARNVVVMVIVDHTLPIDTRVFSKNRHFIVKVSPFVYRRSSLLVR
jgi:hypothetical protein